MINKDEPSFLSILRFCLNLLEPRDRKLLGVYALFQTLLGVLDLLGVALLALVVAIATASVQGIAIPGLAVNISNLFSNGNLTSQELATYLGILAAVLLISKSLLSYYLFYRNVKFLTQRQARISINLAEKIMRQPLNVIQRFNTQEYQNALFQGADAAVVGVLAGSLAFVSELSLQIALLGALLVISPQVFLILIVYFGGIFGILNLVLGRKVQLWHKRTAEQSIEGLRAVADFLGSFREITVLNRRAFFIERFASSKQSMSTYSIKSSMSTQFSKYVFEISTIAGGLGFAAFSFLSYSAIEAASMLALYVAAASRIAPSMLRAQHGLVLIKGAIGASIKFFDVSKSINIDSIQKDSDSQVAKSSVGRNDPRIVVDVRNLSFAYPESTGFRLDSVSLRVLKGELVAIVGPSGSGKSTLVDLILGILTPTEGELTVFGVPPGIASQGFSNLAYVPQTVYMTHGSILENVGLGLEPQDISRDRVINALEKVGLEDWVADLPSGIDTKIGERGFRLSGGQRQRIGIARALYSEPKFLVLDEATSSLDAVSEQQISRFVTSLKRHLTTIVIAHRLSTVKHCNRIFYMEKGKILSGGTFDELQSLVPNFAKQAKLMGLASKGAK